MKIAIDASELGNRREDGTQIYLYNLLKNIAALDTENQYFLYYQNEPKKKVEAPNFIHRIDPWPAYWTQSRLPFLLFKDRPDVLFIPIQTLPFVMPRLKTVITMHDLAFLVYPETFPATDRLKHRIFAWHAVKRADKIIAVSEFTKSDVVKFYGADASKINVVYHGYDKGLFRPFQNQGDCDTMKTVKEKYKISKPYFLYVGALQPRKNILGLIKAFELMNRKDYQLVIAGGKAWLYDELLEYAKESFMRDNIIFTGRFETEELPSLMWGAEAYVLPSFYEGFGMPVLEAMACGTPVITSNVSSLPEVGGDAALLVDPYSPRKISEAMKKVAGTIDLKNRMREGGFAHAAKFSWEKCAQETIEVLTR